MRKVEKGEKRTSFIYLNFFEVLTSKLVAVYYQTSWSQTIVGYFSREVQGFHLFLFPCFLVLLPLLLLKGEFFLALCGKPSGIF